MKKLIETIEKEKLIVIVRGVDRETLLSLADALYEGGIRLMEVTYPADREDLDEYTAETIGILARHTEGRITVGAGTVIRPRQVELTKAAGGKFIISPDTNPDIIKYTKELGLVSIPGALTPSEATLAHRSGADFVKLFPASMGGPAYLKALTAPLSHIRFLAVGGVDRNTMADYMQAGACGFGIGTKFEDPSLLKNRDFAGITEVVKSYVALASSN